MKAPLRSDVRAWTRGIAASALVGIFIGIAPAWARREAPPASIEIRRTADGIPHIRATTWRGLGVGYGQAQAEDALCTLADAFVTFSGQRSLYFGAEAKPQTRSTFGTPANLDLDFFFQAFAGADAVEALKREQPAELNELIAGFAEGYNRHVRGLQAGPQRRGDATHACADAPWVRTIGPEDVYRRMLAAGLAGGYTHFVAEIANAKPAATMPPAPADKLSLSTRLDIPVGDAHGIGSNVLAFGQAATGERGGSVLFGNPHWYWGGPDRFYQAHLTLPGKLDVAGVSFLGIPVIMIGFNNNVAWSHTVSAARRFGMFDLTLDPTDPTRYIVDGRSEPMHAQQLAVAVRRADGTVDLVRRTLYRTRFGPVVDLGARNAALGWSARKAIAIRDINADNPRIFRNFFRWDQARSLDEFIRIQREELAMPWVNTAAIGRGRWPCLVRRRRRGAGGVRRVARFMRHAAVEGFRRARSSHPHARRQPLRLRVADGEGRSAGRHAGRRPHAQPAARGLRREHERQLLAHEPGAAIDRLRLGARRRRPGALDAWQGRASHRRRTRGGGRNLQPAPCEPRDAEDAGSAFVHRRPLQVRAARCELRVGLGGLAGRRGRVEGPHHGRCAAGLPGAAQLVEPR
jgi:hypothetical protein